MPELPEVETVVRTLRPGLVERTIVSLHTGRKKLRQPWSKNLAKQLSDRKVVAISRRGKWIIVEFDLGRLLVHLGMTGQFFLCGPETPRAPHTHLIIELDNEKHLRYRDERRFGSVQWFA